MNPTKALLRIAPLASVLGALILSASPVAAADTTYAGWMVSRNTSAFLEYVTPAADRWNSKGTSTQDDVVRVGTGRYEVTFAGFATADHGAAAVTAIGGTDWCTVPNWTFAGPETTIDINCFAPSGPNVVMADSAFSVNFLDRLTSGGPAIGYAWIDTTVDQDLPDWRTFNAATGTAKPIHVDRTSKGHWTVTFAGLAHASGNVQVTAIQDSIVGTCAISKWAVVGADDQVNVVCHDHSGAVADMGYDLFFVDKVSLRGAVAGAGAYFLASQPSAATYKPGAATRWSSSGKVPVVNRMSVGRYQVTLTGIAGKGGSVQVTAVTGTANRCNVASIPTSGTVQLVSVRCSHVDGTPADTPFSFLFTR
jgi:hypothetical protein